MQRRDPFPDTPELSISAETLAFIVLKARAYDALVAPVDPDDGSNAADDRAVSALEDSSENGPARELASAISSLNDDAQAELVAISWIGRGDFEPDEWSQARILAGARRGGSTSRYLMGMPMLGDFVEEGAARLGVDLTDEESTGLHHPAIEQPAENDRT